MGLATGEAELRDGDYFGTVLNRAAAVLSAGLLAAPGVAHADGCVTGTVKRGGAGGDHFVCQGNAWLHVVPMFDPNSADGYGNQPLPRPAPLAS